MKEEKLKSVVLFVSEERENGVNSRKRRAAQKVLVFWFQLSSFFPQSYREMFYTRSLYVFLFSSNYAFLFTLSFLFSSLNEP